MCTFCTAILHHPHNVKGPGSTRGRAYYIATLVQKDSVLCNTVNILRGPCMKRGTQCKHLVKTTHHEAIIGVWVQLAVIIFNQFKYCI